LAELLSIRVKCLSSTPLVLASDTMNTAEKVRFYFSFRSPFAGIALYRLRHSPLFSEIELEPIPLWPEVIFGGHMDNPTDNLFKLSYVFVDAARQADEAGLDAAQLRNTAQQIELPKDADLSTHKFGLNLPAENWELPHYAFLYAMEQGRGWAFGEQVFMRRFNLDGRGSANVLEPEVIRLIASELQLDPEAAVSAHQREDLQHLQQQHVRSSETDGVFGVPFFAVGNPADRSVFWGNDRLPFLYKQLSGGEQAPVINAASLSTPQSLRP
jgi:2-hydroxychromene-2-carboxylate isomerase